MLPVILALLGALFLLAPILVVVPMSFSTAISFAFPPPGYWLGYYAKYFTNEEWLQPTPTTVPAPLGGTTLTNVPPAAPRFCHFPSPLPGATPPALLMIAP